MGVFLLASIVTPVPLLSHQRASQRVLAPFDHERGAKGATLVSWGFGVMSMERDEQCI